MITNLKLLLSGGMHIIRKLVVEPKQVIKLAILRLGISLPSRLTALLDGDNRDALVRFLDRTGQYDKLAEHILSKSDDFSLREIRSCASKLRKSLINPNLIVASKPWAALVDSPRILFIVTNSLPHTQSGYTLRTHETLKSLIEHGVHCEAVTRSNYPVSVGKIPRNAVDVIEGVKYHRLYNFPGGESFGDVVQLAQLAKQMDANAIHTTTDYRNAITASAVAEKLDVPWIYEVRGELESTWLSKVPSEWRPAARDSLFYRNARALETSAMRKAARVITLSEVYAEGVVSRGVSRDIVRVIPNGVTLAKPVSADRRNDLRASLGVCSDVKIVGIISSLVPYEGVDDLISAFVLLPDNFFLLVVGDGISRTDLEKQAQKVLRAERFKFVGKQPRENIEEWYAALDIFVVPRKDELVTRRVTPIKALQAQAQGTPVVASDLPALREITGNLAIYFKPGDHSALAAAIRRAADKGKIAEQIPWAESHSWERLAELYLDLYGGT